MQYAYYHEEDDASFQLVHTTKIPKPLHQRGKLNRMNQKLNQARRQQQVQQAQQVFKIGRPLF